jgi:hypothetical protein
MRQEMVVIGNEWNFGCCAERCEFSIARMANLTKPNTGIAADSRIELRIDINLGPRALPLGPALGDGRGNMSQTRA